jgi:hypothetical protein
MYSTPSGESNQIPSDANFPRVLSFAFIQASSSMWNNTRLVKPRFGVVVYRTPTEEFDIETGVAQATEKIIAENDQASWLH